MQFGSVDVQIIHDATIRIDGGAMFGVVPRILWERKLAPDERNRVPMALRCLLIRDGRTTVLVDTGIGDKLSDKEARIFSIDRPVGLIGLLAQHGVRPEEVDVVLDTHLHVDHAGGNTTLRDGVPVPTFPRAAYWIQRAEWEDAIRPNERTAATYLAENLLPIDAAGQTHFFDGPTDVIPGVRWLMAPGHTRAHTAILVEGGGRSLLFPVDVCPFAAHLERLAWIPAFDVLPLVALETKRRLVADCLEASRLVVFDHDPIVTIARLTGSIEEWRVEPVATPE